LGVSITLNVQKKREEERNREGGVLAANESSQIGDFDEFEVRGRISSSPGFIICCGAVEIYEYECWIKGNDIVDEAIIRIRLVKQY